MYIRIVPKPNNWFHKSRDQRRKGEINCNCVCAINRQSYGSCQYGTPSLNISPEDRFPVLRILCTGHTHKSKQSRIVIFNHQNYRIFFPGTVPQDFFWVISISPANNIFAFYFLKIIDIVVMKLWPQLGSAWKQCWRSGSAWILIF